MAPQRPLSAPDEENGGVPGPGLRPADPSSTPRSSLLPPSLPPTRQLLCWLLGCVTGAFLTLLLLQHACMTPSEQWLALSPPPPLPPAAPLPPTPFQQPKATPVKEQTRNAATSDAAFPSPSPSPPSPPPAVVRPVPIPVPVPFSPPPIPSLCLCSRMYVSSASTRPSEWTLQPVPLLRADGPRPADGPAVDVAAAANSAPFTSDELLSAARVLATVGAASPYPSSLTGNASSSDERWLRWRFWDECGLLEPRTVLLHSPPPVVGPQLDWQLPTCLLHDVWIRTHVEEDDDPQRQDSTRPTDPDQSPSAASPSASASSSSAPSSVPFRRHVAPLYSVALQIFNAEDGVSSLLLSLLSTTRGPFELVLLFDSAEDESWPRVESVLRAVLQHCDVDEQRSVWPTWSANGRFPPVTHPDGFPSTRRAANSSASLPFVSCLNPWLVHVRVMLQPTPVWETSGNNIQMRAAHPLTRYWISVQDDQPQRTRGWNQLLAAPLRWWPNSLLGVSARCAHGRYTRNATLHNPCRNPSHAMDASWTGDMRCRVYVRDTANRGPLLLDYRSLRRLGFLDEMAKRIEDDDHDLFARAWEAHRQAEEANGGVGVGVGAAVNSSSFPSQSSSSGVSVFGSRAAFVPLEWDQQGVVPGRRRRRPARSANELAWMAARDQRARRPDAPEFGLTRVRRKALAQHWPPHDADLLPPAPLLRACLQQPGGVRPQQHADSERHEAAAQLDDPWSKNEPQPWWQQRHTQRSHAHSHSQSGDPQSRPPPPATEREANTHSQHQTQTNRTNIDDD